MPEIICPTCGHAFTLSEGVSVSECPGCGDSLLVSGGVVERAEATPLAPMWYYVDANGQQAGPVTEPRAVRLVEHGLIRPETLVWQQGMSDWQPLGGSRLGMLAVRDREGMSVTSWAPALPVGLAVGGMVTGISGLVLSCTCIGWFLGLPLAIVSMALSGAALQQAKAGKAGGRGMAIAGLTCSLVTIGVLVVLLIFFAVGAGFNRRFMF